ncbi:uncharacterized protein LOC117645452 [Thrips palmi]|uniref:Uncharacterized protein LOC117645452 n=1 Tax=Thrips palmi TaxID=161013 RepID=A0A6P8ZN12_THRPL|nr:uncharacterized protein LOC117645452 [Thrips palmi]
MDILTTALALVPALPFVPFPWERARSYAVVPAPLGLRRGPLAAWAGEMSPAACWSTHAAILAVATGMCLLRRRGPLSCDATKALSKPLPSGLRLLQRPVLGCWLLVGVVLLASYQGRLLSSANDRDSVGDIKCVGQLADSNLTILLPNPVSNVLFLLREWRLAGRVRYTEPEGLSLADVLRHIGAVRDAATLVTQASVENLPPLQMQRARVRLFLLPQSMDATDHVVMRGWPFEASFRRFLGRWRAAGLYSKFSFRETSGLAHQAARPQVPRTSFEPLRLKQVQPVVRVLLTGCLSSCLVLVVELFVSFTVSATQDSMGRSNHISNGRN